MKPGSLVVVKPLGLYPGLWRIGNTGKTAIIKWLPIDDEKHEYEIRETYPGGATLVEGVVGHCIEDNDEVIICYEQLREVQPPMEISVNNIIADLEPVNCENRGPVPYWRSILQRMIDEQRK